MTTVDIRAAERPGATPPRFGHAAPNIDVPAFDPELDRAERVQRAEAAAEQLVSTTFVLPILEEMHKSSFAAGPFAPGVGEKRFTPCSISTSLTAS